MMKRRELLLTLAASLTARSAFSGQMHDHSHGKLAPQSRSRLDGSYAVPGETLVDQNGNNIVLAQQLARPGPVLLNFIFTTCPGICPILSAVFSQTAVLLGTDLHRVRMWSISIDPDFDRPDKLRTYAEAFDAPPEWSFFTGEKQAIHKIRNAFDADSDNKMAHTALFLLRLHGDSWARFEGDVTAVDLAAATREVLANSS